MVICIRLRSPGIAGRGGIAQSKELHSLTAGSAASTGEANGARSAPARDTECEKGLDVVLAITAADLSGGGWEGSPWEVFLDHNGDSRVVGRRAGS